MPYFNAFEKLSQSDRKIFRAKYKLVDQDCACVPLGCVFNTRNGRFHWASHC
jgi:hypothetical protein